MFGSNPLADSCLDELIISLLQEVESREKGHLADTDMFSPDAYTSTAGASMTGALQQKSNGHGEYDKKEHAHIYCGGLHRPHLCDKVKARDDKNATPSDDVGIAKRNILFHSAHHPRKNRRLKISGKPPACSTPSQTDAKSPSSQHSHIGVI